MPIVDIYYKFQTDALIDTIRWIKFQNQEAKFWEDRQGPHVYEGKVAALYVSDRMEVEFFVYGADGQSCTMSVEVQKMQAVAPNEPTYAPVGNRVKLETDPITDTVKGSTCFHEKVYKILF